MTISSTQARVNYLGNGTVSTFTFPFRIDVASDVEVTRQDTSGNQTKLALTTDYTVSPTSFPAYSGGSVTLVSGALATGYKLTIRRVKPLTQNTDVRNQGTFYPDSIENEFDQLLMIDQQQQDELSRSVRLPSTIDPSTFDPHLPAGIVGQASATIVTDPTGTGIALGPSTAQIAASNAAVPTAVTAASNAAASQTAAAGSATAAAGSATAAAGSATAAAGSATAAASSATAAAGSAASAAGSATTATTQASTATTQASTATTQAGVATTQAGNASTSATNAAASATAASGSATSAAASAASAAAVAQGLSVKLSSVAATTGALPANTYNNGAAGAGATLTGNANGALAAVDGITLAAGQRVLVKNEAAGANNGIYTLTQVGDASHPYILTRATDANSASTVFSGIYSYIEQGATNGNQSWALATLDPITVGTTSLTFTQFTAAGEYTFSSGVKKSGNAVSADIDNVTLDLTGTSIEIKNNGASNAKLAQMPANTVKGNNTGGAANAADLTVAQLLALVTPLTTKGDLMSTDGTTSQRLAAGANGTVLTADSTQSLGLKWTTPLTNPMTTGGDIIVGGASGATTRLANGLSRQVLTAQGGTTAPAWLNPFGTVQSKSANYTVTANDGLMIGNATSAAFTFTLPTGSTVPGIPFWFKKSDSDATFNAITITDGTFTTTLNSSGETVCVMYTGSAYEVLDRRIPGTTAVDAGFTPNSFGTVTAQTITRSRRGDKIAVQGVFTCGTVTASVATLSQPTGLAIDYAKLSASTMSAVGTYINSAGSTTNLYGGNNAGTVIVDGADTAKVYFSNSTSPGGWVKSLANAISVTSQPFSFFFEVPISGWKG